MKYNYLDVYSRINNLPPRQRYWVLGYAMGDHGFNILNDETNCGRLQFRDGKLHLSNAERCRIIMKLNMLGFSTHEIVLTEYLFNYRYYVKTGMHKTEPFHKNMKKEIKNLIDKVESGII